MSSSPVFGMFRYTVMKNHINSVGLIPRRPPFTIPNNSVGYFMHAVSLNECRATFRAGLCPPESAGHDFVDASVGEDTSQNSRKRHVLKELERQWSDATTVRMSWRFGSPVR